jgi:lipopolysaccharide transport system permease protein
VQPCGGLGAVYQPPTGEIPYPLFAYSGLVVWTYFANALNQSSNSLAQYERLITKVYFPRLLVPLASVVAGLADFLDAFVVLVVLTSYYGFVPTARRLDPALFRAARHGGSSGPL